MKKQTIIFTLDDKEVVQEGEKFFTRIKEGDEYFDSGDYNTLKAAKESLGIVETVDNNQLIDTFLDSKGEYISHKDQWGGEYWGEYKPNKYYNDWNCLMQAVEKIETIEEYRFDFQITQSVVSIYDKDDQEDIIEFYGDDKKEVVYAAVVGFIEWYNSAEKEN